MNDKRKRIQDLIDKVLRALDVSGKNAEKYRKMFEI